MSLFRRSMMSTIQYPNIYKATFKMKFDLENYDYTQYGLHIVMDSTNKVNVIDKYGIGFFLAYDAVRDDYAECKQSLGILEEDTIIIVEMATESMKYKKTITLTKGHAFGVSINFVHDINAGVTMDLIKRPYNVLTSDSYYYQYADAPTHGTNISNINPPIAYVSPIEIGLGELGYEKVFISTQNLLPNGKSQIYNVTLTVQSLQAFKENRLQICNCAGRNTTPATGDGKSAPTTYDYYACQCKYGEFEGDSIFKDDRFGGVE
jgi:hypothetical protein